VIGEQPAESHWRQRRWEGGRERWSHKSGDLPGGLSPEPLRGARGREKKVQPSEIPERLGGFSFRPTLPENPPL